MQKAEHIRKMPKGSTDGQTTKSPKTKGWSAFAILEADLATSQSTDKESDEK